MCDCARDFGQFRAAARARSARLLDDLEFPVERRMPGLTRRRDRRVLPLRVGVPP